MKARRDAGMSIRQLQDRTGINRGTISLIEHGRLAPTLDQARRLLRALDDE